MNTRYLHFFLLFLGRQQARLSGDRRLDLSLSLRENCFPPQPEFFQRFPEFAPWREKTAEWWQKAADELERYSEQGLQFWMDEDADFPQSLRRQLDPPWVLTIKGNREVLQRPSLSVVGAREPLRESLRWMEEHFAPALEMFSIGVASGGARGIDQAAHRLAIRYERPTAVFVPSGLQTLYPSELKEWILPVCETGGAFISEFHPRTPMRKWNFETRNRLIAAVSPATFVIQARERSGTWMTAQLAIDAGRTVICLPGSPWERELSGNRKLLMSSNIVPISHAQDLVTFLTSEFRMTSDRSLPIDINSQILH